MYRTLPLAFLFALVATGGCKGDEPGPTEGTPPDQARFADADQDQLAAASLAGAGYLAPIAYVMSISAAFDATYGGNGCPAMTENADGTVTFEADGCTGASGTAYDGSFTAENFFDLFGQGNQDEMWLEYDQFTVDTFVIDGKLWQSQLVPDGAYEAHADLTATIDDLPTVTWLAALDCEVETSGRTLCRADEPAEVSVAGLGAFTVAGPWISSPEGELTGSLVFAGDDELTLDLDGVDEAGCFPATVDGTAIDDICIETWGMGNPGTL